MYFVCCSLNFWLLDFLSFFKNCKKIQPAKKILVKINNLFKDNYFCLIWFRELLWKLHNQQAASIHLIFLNFTRKWSDQNLNVEKIFRNFPAKLYINLSQIWQQTHEISKEKEKSMFSHKNVCVSSENILFKNKFMYF
jgi:hypothetical protein